MIDKSRIEEYTNLVDTINEIVYTAKKNIARNIDKTMIFTYWYIGEHIVEFEQNGKIRAEYGTDLLKKLSKDLLKKIGKGFSWRNLYNMKRFYIEFPKLQTMSAISQNAETLTCKSETEILLINSTEKLSWSHFVRLLSVKDIDERNFYIIETAQCKWSERELDRQINSSLFERLVLSKDKDAVRELSQKGQTIKSEKDILKDPLVLEFLGIKQDSSYSENDLESAIIEHLGTFLLELGKGFSFVARQKRISSGTEHFYIDLVFYNRLLRSFVLIDLKIGKLKHQDIGQMQMYVNYYDREIKTKDENQTIGIILCKENDDFVIEYTLPDKNKQIFANEYRLYLPDKKELKELLKRYL